MNPYIIISFILALIVGGATGEWDGNRRGVAMQKISDQTAIDRINRQIESNKDAAAALLRQKTDELLAMIKQREADKHQLEVKYADARKTTDDLRGQLADRKLRFPATGPAGGGGGSSTGTQTAAGGTATAAAVELPAKITADLRRLAFDADQLRDAYAACYADDQVN